MVKHEVFMKRLQTGFARATKILEKAKGDWSKVAQLLKETGLQQMDLALCGWPIRLSIQGKTKTETKKTPSSVVTCLMLRTLYDAQEKGVESELVEDGKLVAPKFPLKEATIGEYKNWLAQMFPNSDPDYYQFIVDQYK